MEGCGVPPNGHSLLFLRESIDSIDRAIDNRVDEARDLAELLKSCARARDLATGEIIHARIVDRGLDRNRYLSNLLIDMYGKCGSVEDARRAFFAIAKPNLFSWNIAIAALAENGHLSEARALFDRMPARSPSSWNTMISAYARQGRLDEATDFFRAMDVKDEITWNAIVQACAFNGRLDLAQELFDRMPRRSAIAATALAVAYAKVGKLHQARKIFDGMPDRDAVSWNAMLSAYARSGDLDEAKSLFLRIPAMDRAIGSTENSALNQAPKFFEVPDLSPRTVYGRAIMPHKTLVSWNALLAAYVQNGHLREAKRVFDGMPQRDIVTWNSLLQSFAETGQLAGARGVYVAMPEWDVVSANAMIVALGLKGELEEARAIFDAMPYKNLVTWNTILWLHSRSGDELRARSIFDRMPERDLSSWNAMIAAFSEKGQMREARLLLESMPMWDPVSWTLLIAGYGEFGDLVQARRLFAWIPERGGVSWSAIIAAHASNGHHRDALALFCEMDLEGISPEKSSLVSAINACAALSLLPQGSILHEESLAAGIAGDVIVASSLVTMYGKCGRRETAMAVFARMPTKNAIAWSAALLANARNGYGVVALQIFAGMAMEGIVVDEIAFVSVLHSCSHGGLLNEGLGLFASMSSDYGMDPCDAHYACVIDLLARSGHLGKSEELIARMPFEPGSVAWSSLLGACNIQTDARRGQRAAARVSDLEQQNRSKL